MDLLNDRYAFWVFELALVIFCLVAFIANQAAKTRRKNSKAQAMIDRGPVELGRLYNMYLAATFFAVLLTLNVEQSHGYKVVLVGLNVWIIAYLCFFNIWFRNMLLGLTSRLENEKH